MTAGRAFALALSATALAFGSTWLLHDVVRPLVAVTAVLLAGAVLASIRSSWQELPPFVARWLEGGVLTVGVLVVVASSGLTEGLAVAVLRLPRTLTLFGAAAMLATIITAMAYTHTRLQTDVRRTTERLADARRQALESRLAALSAQINPHFLFNTLNTLAEVVHEDEDRAEDLITDLAFMMRYALDKSTVRVSIAEEFELLRRLDRLEQARLGDRLRSTLHLDPAAATARIPGLLLQPLVENAIQHAVASRIDGGTLSVNVSVDGSQVVVRVVDDGPGLPDAVRTALQTPLATDAHAGGLRNVLERTRLTWPDATVDLVPQSPGLAVILTFPLETS